MKCCEYDYLIVGAGLFGAVFAHEMTARGQRCLVVERRAQAGGNLYCQEREGIRIHRYGAHIFHTSDARAWRYVNALAEFNNYVNAPIANYRGEIYNLPFNMNTFARMWGVRTPAEARAIIDAQRGAVSGPPRNLEEQAISLVGTDLFEKLVKGYTEKQWGRDCRDLPAFIIRRLPVRFTYDNNYFNDRWQGIPIGGYNPLIERLLAGSDLLLGVDYNAERARLRPRARQVLVTGAIDEYFGYCRGPLAYRAVRFETERYETENFQGVAVMNYTDRETPYTRAIEHKHFEFGEQPVTYVSREYPLDWRLGAEPYYPINDPCNQAKYEEYRQLAQAEAGVSFGGRLGSYQYLDMDKTILAALELADRTA